MIYNRWMILIGMSLKKTQNLKFPPPLKDMMKNRSFAKVLPSLKEMVNMVPLWLVEKKLFHQYMMH